MTFRSTVKRSRTRAKRIHLPLEDSRSIAATHGQSPTGAFDLTARQISTPRCGLIPPDLCLKNQVQFEANFDRVGIVGDEDGWLRTATGILWADIEGKVYIADTERGRSQMLEGTAADFWNASLKHPTRKETVAYLADVYEQEPSIIEDDHRNFIAHLIDEGVLLPRQSASARASSVSRT